MSHANDLRLLLTAARRGSLSASAARRWARMAAGGEDIAIVAQLHPGAPGLAAGAVTELASDLVGIFAGAGSPLTADEITDAEADALYPPKTAIEADRRYREIEAAAHQLRDTPDDDLYSLIWPEEHR